MIFCLNDEKVLDKLQPITLPYMRSEHIAYIEAFPGYNETEDDVLGILYFRDKGLTEDKDVMIPAKKFFRILYRIIDLLIVTPLSKFVYII